MGGAQGQAEDIKVVFGTTSQSCAQMTYQAAPSVIDVYIASQIIIFVVYLKYYTRELLINPKHTLSYD